MALALEKVEYYTYRDYLTWPDDVRYELIYGEAYALAAPTTRHQRLSMAISSALYTYLDGKKCEVFASPIDVRFTADEDADNVFQPDVVVVCDEEKIDEKGIVGAPDLVVEILSSSTAKNDRGAKYEVYEKEGVREYWIIDPDVGLVETHILSEGGVFRKKSYLASGPVPVHIFGGELSINIGHLVEA